MIDEEITMAEVGEMLGVTESRICQRMGVIRKRVEKAVTLDQALDLYNDGLIDPKLKVDWIKI